MSSAINPVTAPAPAPQSAPLFEALGMVAWLWSASPLHGEWPSALLAVNVLPAIESRQYVMLVRGGMPLAYCSWALLNAEAEARYMRNPNSLRPEDWRCGDRMWFIDWIAPFGGTRTLYRYMADAFPDRVARALRVKKTNQTARVLELRGRAVPRDVAARRFDQWFEEFRGQMPSGAAGTSTVTRH